MDAKEETQENLDTLINTMKNSGIKHIYLTPEEYTKHQDNTNNYQSSIIGDF